MPGILGLLCLSWALVPALAHPLSHGGGTRNSTGGGSWHHLGSQPPLNDTGLMRRCADEEGLDAVTLDETGSMLFFKGDLVWKGFTGPAEPINASWPEIQGSVDAALRIHRLGRPEVHDSVYLFQDERVWSYAHGQLRPGYPRLIGEEFKGVPGDLDAAVECHPKECPAETVLFFKGARVFSYDLESGLVKQRSWPAVSHCSAAVRWLERYYCFQGIRFLRFDPVTGEVPPNYPRDARDYFMRCPGRGESPALWVFRAVRRLVPNRGSEFLVARLHRSRELLRAAVYGHGHEAWSNATLRARRDRCSGRPFQAFSSDDAGTIYAFREGQYFRVDSARDGWHSWPLKHTWKDLEGEVDAAFSWEDKLYLIKGPQVTIYRAGQGYSRVEGYPRPLEEELGVAEADAAFTCPQSQEAYIIQGNHVRRVDLKQSPRRPGPVLHIPHDHVDSALCTATGLYLFHGADFYHYGDVAQLTAATAPAPVQNTAVAFFRCPKGGAGGASPQPPHHG